MLPSTRMFLPGGAFNARTASCGARLEPCHRLLETKQALPAGIDRCPAEERKLAQQVRLLTRTAQIDIGACGIALKLVVNGACRVERQDGVVDACCPEGATECESGTDV